MKKSTSVNCAVAIVLPLSALIRLMSLRTTSPSAPREKPICAGTTACNCRPYAASTSTVVTDAAILPSFSSDQFSSSLTVSLHLEAVVLEEDRVLGRLEPAVGGDEPGVAGVLADLDRDDVVLELERRRRRQPRHLDLDLGDLGRRARAPGFLGVDAPGPPPDRPRIM